MEDSRDKEPGCGFLTQGCLFTNRSSATVGGLLKATITAVLLGIPWLGERVTFIPVAYILLQGPKRHRPKGD